MSSLWRKLNVLHYGYSAAHCNGNRPLRKRGTEEDLTALKIARSLKSSLPPLFKGGNVLNTRCKYLNVMP